MDKDEEHEAMGAMLHRGRVEQAYAKMQERVDEHNDLARRARQYQAELAENRGEVAQSDDLIDEVARAICWVATDICDCEGSCQARKMADDDWRRQMARAAIAVMEGELAAEREELANVRDERDQLDAVLRGIRAELAVERKRRIEADENEKITASFLETCTKQRDEETHKVTKLREVLARAHTSIEPIASLVAATADGFPDHDLCPIRLGQARVLADAFATINDMLREIGECND